MRTTVAALGVVLIAVWARAGDPTEADWTWLQANRGPAFDALMPLSAATGETITYRSYRDQYHDRLERYVQIRTVPGVSVEAGVVRPIAESIQVQLLRLHMEKPAATLGELLPAVRVERTTVQGAACPSVERQVRALHGLRFRIPTRNLLTVHPEVHHVAVRVMSGDVDASLTEDSHPLVKWALATEAAIHACRTP